MRVQTDVERKPWAEFLNDWEWRQGEHVTLLGPTGAGKTTLALQILPRRKYAVVFGTKRRDSTLQQLTKQGYVIKRDWPVEQRYRKVILWPYMMHPGDIYHQRKVFADCLKDVYRRGSWCVYLDEIRYMTDYLKLSSLCELLWQQGRSIGVSLIGGTQRPAYIPTVAYDQVSHLFIWKNNDQMTVRRLRELGAFIDPQIIMDVVVKLERHEVLYLNTREEGLCVTRVERG